MLSIEVIFCPQPGQVDIVTVHVQPGATLVDALQTSGFLARHKLDLNTLTTGVWARAKPLDTVLRQGDRVEIYRPLTVDPKEARRLRYRRDRSAGRPLR